MDSVGVLCQVVMVGCFGIIDDKNVISVMFIIILNLIKFCCV